MYICNTENNQKQSNMKTTFVVSNQEVEVSKTMYSVLIVGGNGDSSSVFESEDETAARERYEKEVKSAGEPVDVTGWSDDDQGWKDLYHIELVKITYDEDGDIIDMVDIESSDDFNMI